MTKEECWPVVSEQCIDQIEKVCNRLLDAYKEEHDDDYLKAVRTLRKAIEFIPTSVP